MRTLTLLLLFLSCIGCQYAPFADEETTVKPQSSDIIGTYQLDKETITGKTENHWKDEPSLKFSKDGTFQALHVPDFNRELDFKYNGQVSVTGKWKIETVGRVEKWNGIKPVWGLRLTNLPTNLTSMSFLGTNPPYRLLVTYGDPDQGKVMIFKLCNFNSEFCK